MNKILYLLLTFCIVSCNSKIQNLRTSNNIDLPYSEEDLNLLSIITYLENQKFDCDNNCNISIDNKVDYFDKCMFEYVYNANELGYFNEKQFNFKLKSFVIEKIGFVYFNSKKSNPDYKFSPVIYDPKEKLIIGQVKKKDGKKEYYHIYIVGDRLLYSSSSEYNYQCWIE